MTSTLNAVRTLSPVYDTFTNPVPVTARLAA